ncbi:MAG: lipocalin-like domain-containing protein, partial [Pseudomonadota bacterium]|nr:lipocalin-like domain-containing protein [Pseudomonadota bacterium]
VDRLAAFDTYISYGGRWRLDGETFITSVEFALNPGWVGKEQTRGVKILPNGEMKLLLSRRWPDGRLVNAWVQWRRATDFLVHSA